MIYDVELLKAQNKKLSEEVKSMKANIADLHVHIIKGAVKRNQLLQERTLDPDGMAGNIATHFQVEMVGSIPRITPKEPMLSLRGGIAGVDEVVTDLLQSKYANMLLPERSENKQPTQDKKQISSDVEKLMTAYQAAKDKGDHKGMVALKRQLHEAGCNKVL
jgi:hypothetical protein